MSGELRNNIIPSYGDKWILGMHEINSTHVRTNILQI